MSVKVSGFYWIINKSDNRNLIITYSYNYLHVLIPTNRLIKSCKNPYGRRTFSLFQENLLSREESIVSGIKCLNLVKINPSYVNSMFFHTVYIGGRITVFIFRKLGFLLFSYSVYCTLITAESFDTAFPLLSFAHTFI